MNSTDRSDVSGDVRQGTVGRCHCGTPLQQCQDCGDARCLRCDPYRSDDCFG